jgi:hypothetical protein
MIPNPGRITRRRSSAPPLAPVPVPPRRHGESFSRHPIRPTFLTLRDYGKVYVADLPRLSDGQLGHVLKEARDILESLNNRLKELELQASLSPLEQETVIRAGTKRDVTERFIQALTEELEQRRNNPALRAAVGESLARTFLEMARHRLPGATFDSLLQEAMAACGSDDGTAVAEEDAATEDEESTERCAPVLVRVTRPAAMPVVLTPDPSPA